MTTKSIDQYFGTSSHWDSIRDAIIDKGLWPRRIKARRNRRGYTLTNNQYSREYLL